MQPLTNTTPGEHTGMAEPAPALLGLAAVGELLRERGYGLSCRFGHVHATRWSQEWHICLVADLAAMPLAPAGLS